MFCQQSPTPVWCSSLTTCSVSSRRLLLSGAFLSLRVLSAVADSFCLVLFSHYVFCQQSPTPSVWCSSLTTCSVSSRRLLLSGALLSLRVLSAVADSFCLVLFSHYVFCQQSPTPSVWCSSLTTCSVSSRRLLLSGALLSLRVLSAVADSFCLVLFSHYVFCQQSPTPSVCCSSLTTCSVSSRRLLLSGALLSLRVLSAVADSFCLVLFSHYVFCQQSPTPSVWCFSLTTCSVSSRRLLLSGAFLSLRVLSAVADSFCLVLFSHYVFCQQSPTPSVWCSSLTTCSVSSRRLLLSGALLSLRVLSAVADSFCLVLFSHYVFCQQSPTPSVWCSSLTTCSVSSRRLLLSGAFLSLRVLSAVTDSFCLVLFSHYVFCQQSPTPSVWCSSLTTCSVSSRRLLLSGALLSLRVLSAVTDSFCLVLFSHYVFCQQSPTPSVWCSSLNTCSVSSRRLLLSGALLSIRVLSAVADSFCLVLFSHYVFCQQSPTPSVWCSSLTTCSVSNRRLLLSGALLSLRVLSAVADSFCLVLFSHYVFCQQSTTPSVWCSSLTTCSVSSRRLLLSGALLSLRVLSAVADSFCLVLFSHYVFCQQSPTPSVWCFSLTTCSVSSRRLLLSGALLSLRVLSAVADSFCLLLFSHYVFCQQSPTPSVWCFSLTTCSVSSRRLLLSGALLSLRVLSAVADSFCLVLFSHYVFCQQSPTPSVWCSSLTTCSVSSRRLLLSGALLSLRVLSAVADSFCLVLFSHYVFCQQSPTPSVWCSSLTTCSVSSRRLLLSGALLSLRVLSAVADSFCLVLFSHYVFCQQSPTPSVWCSSLTTCSVSSRRLLLSGALLSLRVLSAVADSFCLVLFSHYVFCQQSPTPSVWCFSLTTCSVSSRRLLLSGALLSLRVLSAVADSFCLVLFSHYVFCQQSPTPSVWCSSLTTCSVSSRRLLLSGALLSLRVLSAVADSFCLVLFSHYVFCQQSPTASVWCSSLTTCSVSSRRLLLSGALLSLRVLSAVADSFCLVLFSHYVFCQQSPTPSVWCSSLTTCSVSSRRLLLYGALLSLRVLSAVADSFCLVLFSHYVFCQQSPTPSVWCSSLTTCSVSSRRLLLSGALLSVRVLSAVADSFCLVLFSHYVFCQQSPTPSVWCSSLTTCSVSSHRLLLSGALLSLRVLSAVADSFCLVLFSHYVFCQQSPTPSVWCSSLTTCSVSSRRLLLSGALLSLRVLSAVADSFCLVLFSHYVFCQQSPTPSVWCSSLTTCSVSSRRLLLSGALLSLRVLSAVADSFCLVLFSHYVFCQQSPTPSVWCSSLTTCSVSSRRLLLSGALLSLRVLSAVADSFCLVLFSHYVFCQQSPTPSVWCSSLTTCSVSSRRLLLSGALLSLRVLSAVADSFCLVLFSHYVFCQQSPTPSVWCSSLTTCSVSSRRLLLSGALLSLRVLSAVADSFCLVLFSHYVFCQQSPTHSVWCCSLTTCSVSSRRLLLSGALLSLRVLSAVADSFCMVLFSHYVFCQQSPTPSVWCSSLTTCSVSSRRLLLSGALLSLRVLSAVADSFCLVLFSHYVFCQQSPTPSVWCSSLTTCSVSSRRLLLSGALLSLRVLSAVADSFCLVLFSHYVFCQQSPTPSVWCSSLTTCSVSSRRLLLSGAFLSLRVLSAVTDSFCLVLFSHYVFCQQSPTPSVWCFSLTTCSVSSRRLLLSGALLSLRVLSAVADSFCLVLFSPFFIHFLWVQSQFPSSSPPFPPTVWASAVFASFSLPIHSTRLLDNFFLTIYFTPISILISSILLLSALSTPTIILTRLFFANLDLLLFLC